MKQKTHSGTKKRVMVTGKKKLKMRKSCKNHLLVHKSKRSRKSNSRSGKMADRTNIRKLRKLLVSI